MRYAICEFGFDTDTFDLLSFISICLSIMIKLRGIKSNVYSYLYSKFERNTLRNKQNRLHYIGVGLEVAASVLLYMFNIIFILCSVGLCTLYKSE